MDSRYSIENSFSTTAPGKLLFRLAPPVMPAFLIQALYNIVDSYFVGKNSDSGLTALSLIYPIQLLMTALGIGTGVGVNTLIARFDGERNSEAAEGTARTGSFLGLINRIAFTVLIIPALCLYLRYSSDSESIRRDAAVYGYIVCLGSLGLFMESIWTKILQARGNMTVPLLAQMAGAALNILLDPLLIFGMYGFPRWGVAGAAVATVSGQFAAAAVTGECRVYGGRHCYVYFHPGTTDRNFYPQPRCHCNRHSRFPHYRRQFYPGLPLSDPAAFLSGNRKGNRKYCGDGCAADFSSGAARLSALALRSDRFLADVSPLGYVNRCFRSFSSEKSLQRFYEGRCSRRPLSVKSKKAGQCPAFGEYGTRTHGLLIANQLLYQLS